MSELLIEIAMGWIRAGLALATGYLVQRHLVTASQGDRLVTELLKQAMIVTPLLFALLWSAVQKIKGRLKINDALWTPVPKQATKVLGALLLCLLLPSMASAQAWPGDGIASGLVLPAKDQIYAQIFSDATVAASIGLDVWTSWKAPDRKQAFQCQAMRDAVDLVLSEVIKLVVHRIRPDGSDAMSFWSEHTAFSLSPLGGARLAFVIPLAIGTGAGRIAGDKHYLSDVAAGAGAGAIVALITHHSSCSVQGF